jgi:hypothetical protein
MLALSGNGREASDLIFLFFDGDGDGDAKAHIQYKGD